MTTAHFPLQKTHLDQLVDFTCGYRIKIEKYVSVDYTDVIYKRCTQPGFVLSCYYLVLYSP